MEFVEEEKKRNEFISPLFNLHLSNHETILNSNLKKDNLFRSQDISWTFMPRFACLLLNEIVNREDILYIYESDHFTSR